MIGPLRARLISRRYRDLVGRPVKAYRKPSGLWIAFFAGLWLLELILLSINPMETMAGNVAYMVFFGLLFFAIYRWLTNAWLVICERGIVIGYFARFMPWVFRFVIGAEEIDPRTVAVLSDGKTAAAMMNLDMGSIPGMMDYPQFFLNRNTLAVSFNGPIGAEAMPGRSSRRRRWGRGEIYMFSHPKAAVIADEILQAIGRSGGIPQGFRPFNDLQSVQLTGRPEDATRQIPGSVPLI